MSSIEESIEDFNATIEEFTNLRLKGEDRLEALVEIANDAYAISNNVSDNERLHWLKQGYTYAKQAYELNPKSLKVLRVLSQVTGRLAEESSTTSRLSYGREFKQYLNAAIDADDHSDEVVTFELHHMRGRFMYTVLQASTLERMAARTWGWDLNFTYQDAVNDMLFADELTKMAENQLFIAKCYIGMGDKKSAKKWLKKVTEHEDADTVKEQEYGEEALQMLADL